MKVLALDPSKGRDAQHGDYSAFVWIGIDKDDVIYVEADLARRPTPLGTGRALAAHADFAVGVFAHRGSLRASASPMRTNAPAGGNSAWPCPGGRSSTTVEPR